MHIQRANDHRPRIAQTLNNFGIGIGDNPLPGTHSGAQFKALDGYIRFDADDDTFKRALRIALEPPVAFLCRTPSAVAVDLNKSAQHGVMRIDPRQIIFQQSGRRDLVSRECRL